MRVNFYAAAADAAGTTSLVFETPGTVAQLLDRLVAERPGLAPVLARSSLLVDGEAILDPSTTLPEGARVDVLPPFAGG